MGLRGFSIALLALASGCGGVDCGSPSQIDGTYAMFTNVLTYDGTNLEAFPSYESPANGWAPWVISWGKTSQADVIVEIDDQEFAGSGTWDPVECGNFTLDFAGLYVSEVGTQHQFTSTGQYLWFTDSIEGVWDYAEDWTNLASETGTFTTNGQVSGSIVEAGE